MNPWVQWKMANYLKGNDPIGDTPIFDFHDYGRLGGGFKYFLFSARKLGKIPNLTNIFQRG